MVQRFLASIFFASFVAHSAAARSAGEWLSQADTLEREGKTRETLAALVEADKLRPNEPAILVRIAKQHGDLLAELKNRRERQEAAATALRLSRRALELDPKRSDAHLAVAISLGKSTEFMGNREKIEVSREIRDHAKKALALNPRCDYSHHMLGRWHQELAGIGGTTRTIARLIYGSLPDASYDEALHHFGRARALRSDRLIHKIEYGRTLAMMDRTDQAREILTKAVAMPNREKDDADAKHRGREMLKSIQ